METTHTSTPTRHRALLLVRLALFLVVAFGATAAEVRAERSYLGVAVAAPTVSPDTAMALRAPNILADSLQLLVLSLSQQGEIDSVVNALPADSQLINNVLTAVGGAKLTPATRDGQPIASLLPIVAVRRRPLQPLQITYPVDHKGSIADYDLYRLALALNGVTPATITYFPSFHFVMSAEDSVGTFPSLTMRVTIDSTGRLVDRTIARTNFGTFSDHMLSATNWAEFNPARVDGRPVSSTGYLVILGFPDLHYPTAAFHSDSAMSVQRQFQLQFIADSCRLLTKPVPRRVFSDSLLIKLRAELLYQAGTITMTVDTLGFPNNLRSNHRQAAADSLMKAIAGRLIFNPALSWNGDAIEFEGNLWASYQYSGIVRTDILWLPVQPPHFYTYPVEQ